MLVCSASLTTVESDLFYFFSDPQLYFNPFTAMMSFENNQKVQNLKPLSLFVFFFALACDRILIKMHSIESRCYLSLIHI